MKRAWCLQEQNIVHLTYMVRSILRSSYRASIVSYHALQCSSYVLQEVDDATKISEMTNTIILLLA